MTERLFRYNLFGLAIASEIELTELHRLDDHADPQVTIRLGAIPPGLPEFPGHHPLDNGELLVIGGVARFLAHGGRHLLVEPAAEAPPRNLRLFLLGSALSMIIHQRGLLPLHANAVVIGGRAFAFVGPSGAGKSTLAAWFSDRGFPLLCDDVCVVSFDSGGQACAWPGLPRLRLWQDALEWSGRDTRRYQRSFDDDGAAAVKYDVPLAATAQPQAAVPLGAVVLLEQAETAALTRFAPPEALATLYANTYRGELLVGWQREAAWQTCLEVARVVPLHRWVRPWRLDDFDHHVEWLVAALAG